MGLRARAWLYHYSRTASEDRATVGSCATAERCYGVPRAALRFALGYLIMPLWGWGSMVHRRHLQNGSQTLLRAERQQRNTVARSSEDRARTLDQHLHVAWASEPVRGFITIRARPRRTVLRLGAVLRRNGATAYPGRRFALPWAISLCPFGAGEPPLGMGNG